MRFDTYWEDLSSSERELFQKSCRKLLKETFIVRDKDDSYKKLYFFISKNPDIFTVYFSFIGFDITLDRENGVIMLKNYAEPNETGKIQSNRLRLSKDESIVLCCLWTLYMERIRSGSLIQTIIVSMADLTFELEKYGLKEPIKKKRMEDILNLLSKYNLIDMNRKTEEKDTYLIRLYPSLQFALDMEEFRKFTEAIEKNLKITNSEQYDEGDVEDDE